MIDLKQPKYFGRLHDFEKYLELMEAQLEEAKHLSSATEFASYDLSDPEHEGEYRAFKDQHDEYYNEILAGIFRRSYVISFHSFIDLWFEGLCREIQKADERIKLSLKDLRGDSLERVNRYLEIVLDVKISDIPEWAFLLDLKRIRNCLVHADGIIERAKTDKDRKRLWALIEENSGTEKLSGVTVNEGLRTLIKKKDDKYYPKARESAKLVVLKGYCDRTIHETGSFFRAALRLTKVYP